MDEQKKNIMDFVDEQSAKGKTITETLEEMDIKRSTYYSWLKTPQKKRTDLPRAAMLTPDEKKAIEDAKEEHPLMRHGHPPDEGPLPVANRLPSSLCTTSAHKPPKTLKLPFLFTLQYIL